MKQIKLADLLLNMSKVGCAAKLDKGRFLSKAVGESSGYVWLS